MIREESKTRLPYFGISRGKVLFRYAHQELERMNEEGALESYWECRHIVYDPEDVPVQDEAAARELCLAAIRAEAKEQIEEIAGYPQWFQNNVANGLYPSDVADAMTAYIASVITESNRCEDLVETESIDDALSVVPNWPEV